jgi:hypothetical protein
MDFAVAAVDSFEANLKLLSYPRTGDVWALFPPSSGRPKLLKSNALLALCTLVIIPQQSWVGASQLGEEHHGNWFFDPHKFFVAIPKSTCILKPLKAQPLCARQPPKILEKTF